MSGCSLIQFWWQLISYFIKLITCQLELISFSILNLLTNTQKGSTSSANLNFSQESGTLNLNFLKWCRLLTHKRRCLRVIPIRDRESCWLIIESRSNKKSEERLLTAMEIGFLLNQNNAQDSAILFRSIALFKTRTRNKLWKNCKEMAYQ